MKDRGDGVISLSTINGVYTFNANAIPRSSALNFVESKVATKTGAWGTALLGSLYGESKHGGEPPFTNKGKIQDAWSQSRFSSLPTGDSDGSARMRKRKTRTVTFAEECSSKGEAQDGGAGKRASSKEGGGPRKRAHAREVEVAPVEADTPTPCCGRVLRWVVAAVNFKIDLGQHSHGVFAGGVMADGNVPTPFWRALQREDRQWHGYHWYSGCQKSVALSTCNAEYATLSGAVQEVTWLSQMLAFLGFGSDQPMAVYEDNEEPRHWQRSRL